MKNVLLTVFYFVLFIQLNGQALTDPGAMGMSSERLARLDAVMHQYVDQGMLSGVQTAIMRRGELVHFDTYGYQDMDSEAPLQDNSIWRIYSMTKPIVSVGLMMLYEEGRFQLNDPVAKYIPAFADLQVYHEDEGLKSAQNQMKIIDILRHTSGIGYGWGPGSYVDSVYQSVDFFSIATTKDLNEILASTPLYFEPGTAWRYGLSVDVSGYLIEVLSGMPLDEYLEQKIFTPLGMTDTSFEVPDDKEDRFVSNYQPQPDGSMKLIDHPSWSPYTKEVTHFSGGGGLVSTTSDYMKFCQMLINGGDLNGSQILSPKTIELMTQNHTEGIAHHSGGPVKLPANGNDFGLGFSVVTDLAETRAIGSEGVYGWGGLAGTFFRIDPEEELVYIMMIQIIPNAHLQARERFQTMVYQAIVD